MHVALLRGINVGRAKRVAMADLRALVEGLGYRQVRTLLNSGNVVFEAAGVRARDAGARIEKAIAARLGVATRVIALEGSEFAVVMAQNTLAGVADNPSRLLVGVLADPADRARLKPLLAQDWGTERIAVGTRAVYLWCPEGLLVSRLSESVARLLGDRHTMRNAATMAKIAAMMASATRS